MKINFNDLREINVSNMNGGNGNVRSKMFMNDDCKIIRAVLDPNSSMGKHVQKNNEFIYVLSGRAKVIINGEEELLNQGDVHYCPFGSTHEIINDFNEDLVLLDITVEK